VLLKTFIRFIVTIVIVTAISVVTTFFILKNNQENKITQLDKTARLISGQVSSANLNSILGFTHDYFIFIIHKRDGRLLFESGKRPQEDLRIWEENKYIVFKEMMQQAEGTLVYPELESWKILSAKKIVRYMAIPDLDWVLAVELPASVTLSQLTGVYSPGVAGGILLASLLITACFNLGNGKRKMEPDNAGLGQKDPPPAAVEPVAVVTPAAKAPVDYAYQKRLIAEARKQLESGKAKLAAVKTEAEDVTAKINEQKAPVLEKRIAEKIAKPEEPPQKQDLVKPVEIAKAETEIKAETKEEIKEEAKPPAAANPTEVYFDKLMEKKKGKPQPDTIIGMALSKKMHREKLDT